VFGRQTQGIILQDSLLPIRGASINLRPDPALDSIAKILEFKVCALKVEAVLYENADK
jgi:hypothetical protein